MVWLWDNAVTIGTVVMAVAAIVALIYAHQQISESRKAERRGNANELWREYLRLAFEHPSCRTRLCISPISTIKP